MVDEILVSGVFAVRRYSPTARIGSNGYIRRHRISRSAYH